MSDDQYKQIVRWFEKLSRQLEDQVGGLKAEVVSIKDEIHEIRELLAHLQNDDRVQRDAIADHSRRIAALESPS